LNFGSPDIKKVSGGSEMPAGFSIQDSRYVAGVHAYYTTVLCRVCRA